MGQEKDVKDEQEESTAQTHTSTLKFRLWHWLKTFLKFGVTGVALYWVFSKVDFGEVRLALLDSNPLFLALAFIANIFGQAIASVRLNGHFNAIGLRLGEVYNFRLFLLGLFYNLFLPGGIGGDGYKLYFLRKQSAISTKKIFSAIFFDRLSGLWALAMFTGALVVMMPQLQIPSWLPLPVLLLGTLIYFWVLGKFFSDFKAGFVRNHFRALGSWFFQILAVILLLYALGFNGKFSPYLFVFLFSSLAAVFPFSIGGLGVREIVNVQGAEYFGLDPHLALLISLLFYLISALFAVFGAYFLFNPRKLGVDHLPDAKEVEDSAKAADRQVVED
jgi:uncharacterized membrane protein YbhN (UPF0104 family)